MFANGLQPWHILVLVVVLIALFGAKRLPGAARGIGQSMRIFKSEAKQMRNGDDDEKDEAAATGQADKHDKHETEQPAQLESTKQPEPEDPVKAALQQAKRTERRSASASAQASETQQSQTETQA